VKVVVAQHTTDIMPHYGGYLDHLLEDADAVVVSPYMEVEVFKPYGQRVLISLHGPFLQLDLAGWLVGKLWEHVGGMSVGFGLGLCVPSSLALRAYTLWPRALIWVKDASIERHDTMSSEDQERKEGTNDLRC
jgi:hypothetical protein